MTALFVALWLIVNPPGSFYNGHNLEWEGPFMNQFSAEYLDYIGSCKTEWEAAAYAEKKLAANGFRNVEEVLAAGEKLRPGDKVYETNRDRGVCAAVIGEKDSFQIVSGHLDSPLVFLRPDPAEDRCGLAVANAYGKGGARRHTWVDIPLALHGKLVMRDNSILELTMGEQDSDPVVFITEIAAHLAKKQNGQALKDAYTDDQLNIIFGSLAKDQSCRTYLDQLLRERFGASYDDLKYGDIYVVPAPKPREVGLDRSLIAAYGQDDRICVYCALQAVLDAKPTGNTAVAMLFDREELGSRGNTAADSEFYRNFLLKLRVLTTGDGSLLGLTQALSKAKAVNGDVTWAMEPMDPGLLEAANNAVLGRGTTVSVYGVNGEPQFRGSVQRLLDEKQIAWQVSTGQTNALSFSSSVSQSFNKQNMDAISIGPALSGMHTAYELVSKFDLYTTYQSYLAFLEANTLL